MRNSEALFLGAVLLVTSGCGTLYNHEIGPCPKSQADSFRVYGGVRKDLEQAISLVIPGSPQEVVMLPLYFTLLAVDLPLSAVGDTLGLPITISAAFGKITKTSQEGPEVNSEP